MAGVVIQGTTTFVLGGTPGASLGPQYDRTESLGANVMHLSESAGLDDPSGLLERADEAIVVSDLIDEPLGFSHGSKTLAVGDIEHEGLLAKHVKVALERL